MSYWYYIYVQIPRLFTVPYFFVRSFRYTASYHHEYLDFQIYVLASSQTTPALV